MSRSSALSTKVLTFESWVTNQAWYKYAQSHPQQIPFPLIDRSPCQDPFFDPYAHTAATRRPLISGLCRLLKTFAPGDQFIYVTRIDPALYGILGVRATTRQAHYFAVAALQVTRVWSTHAEAADSFTGRQFVSCPVSTPYPPNLAHDDGPIAAVSRTACVVHTPDKQAILPSESTSIQWHEAYMAYHQRYLQHQLHVAECQVKQRHNREALCLHPQRAPITTADDWGGQQVNTGGLYIEEHFAERIRSLLTS